MIRFFSSLRRSELSVFSILALFLAVLSFYFIADNVAEWNPLALPISRGTFIAAYLSGVILSVAALFFFTPFRPIVPWMLRAFVFGLPSILVFMTGWYLSESIPPTAKAATSFFWLFAGALLFAWIIGKERKLFHDPEGTPASVKEWFRKQGLAAILFVVGMTGVFFGFASHHLGQFAAVDEALWLYGRIPKYWTAIEELQFAKTNISDKPGITVALTSGAALLSEANPLAWKTVEGWNKGIEGFFFLFRFPIVLLATILLPLFYFLLERIGGRTRALFAYTLITLSPTTLGMTKIINPDSLLWLFAPLSLLSYFAYLKRRHLGYLALAGVLLGLALLTKYVANIVFVFLLGVLLLEYAMSEKEEPFFEYLRRSLLSYALFTFVALSVFLVLFPAVWLRPEKILDATILSQAFESTSFVFLGIFGFLLADQFLTKAKATRFLLMLARKYVSRIVIAVSLSWIALAAFVALNSWLGMRVYDFPSLLAAPKTIAKQIGMFGVFTSNFYPLLFGIVPIAFFALLAAPFLSLRKDATRTWTGKLPFYLLLFILLYYLGSTINGVGTITRYQIMLFPIATAIAGFILGGLFLRLKPRFNDFRFGRFALPGALAVVALCGIWTLATNPFPLSYASSLLPKNYATDVKDMGPGSYLAAQYLSTLPDAKRLTIWTDKSGVCKFFDGICKSGFSWENYRDEHFDYIVVSAGRESRTSKRVNTAVEDARSDVIRFDTYYGKENPAWELLINGRPSHYVKIYHYEK